jgi:hypothetical protein
MLRAIALPAMMALLLGAADEPVAPLGSYTAAERRYWAFQPRANPQPPVLTDTAAKAWIRTPIDAFLLEGLRKKGLKPAPKATREELIRRATYDMLGLPPTPAEIDAFLHDTSPAAWGKVVDRLLASPQYGEQWGRHWLDVVRFAESDGYEYDMHRPDGYRYRDYVVRSFNEDKPYDQFVKEQIAGDEMDRANETYLVASGFNRLGPLRKNAGNQDVASSRNEVLTEAANIVGAAFLGLTVGCARCHDHKFDPIRQSDYYRLQAHFAQLQPDDIVQASKEEQDAYKAKVQPIEQELSRLQAQMRRAPESEKAKLEAQLESLDEKMPPPLTSIYSVKDTPQQATPIKILFHGDHLSPTAKVGVRPLGILVDAAKPEEPLNTSTPRLKLADWIVDPANPLTARVMANRVWQYHFGRGLVVTPNDFGRMGGRPSNPQLLDWLANQHVEGGWKLKPIHRMILMSSAYQQSSASPIEKLAQEKDPENALLWKFTPRRLEAEEIRDSMLAASGTLNAKLGGPSFMVPIDKDLVLMLKRPQYWTPTRDKSEYDRRTLYMIYKRNLRLPFLEVFDAPDTLSSCGRREQATHAPQALELLNGKTSNELATRLSERLIKERKTAAERIDLGFRLTAGRAPDRAEFALAMKFLGADANNPAKVKEFSLALFNLNAFLYVN